MVKKTNFTSLSRLPKDDQSLEEAKKIIIDIVLAFAEPKTDWSLVSAEDAFRPLIKGVVSGKAQTLYKKYKEWPYACRAITLAEMYSICERAIKKALMNKKRQKDLLSWCKNENLFDQKFKSNEEFLKYFAGRIGSYAYWDARDAVLIDDGVGTYNGDELKRILTAFNGKHLDDIPDSLLMDFLSHMKKAPKNPERRVKVLREIVKDVHKKRQENNLEGACENDVAEEDSVDFGFEINQICTRKKTLKREHRSGYVYRFLDAEGYTIYIGKAHDIAQRMEQHFGPSGHLAKECYNQVACIAYSELPTLADAEMLEIYLIAKYRPEWNREYSKSGLASLFLIDESKIKWEKFELSQVENKNSRANIGKILRENKDRHLADNSSQDTIFLNNSYQYDDDDDDVDYCL